MTIDLTELFNMQKELGKVGLFAYNGPDRFDKLKLAMLVEVGECANEWRGFKFWSTDQRPRTKEIIVGADGKTVVAVTSNKNPLLEEYVDGLHFVMELGLVINSKFRKPYNILHFSKNVTDKFNSVYLLTAKLDEGMSLIDDQQYKYLLTEYVELADYLGFTWDEVEKEYYRKNKINHKRQAEGY